MAYCFYLLVWVGNYLEAHLPGHTCVGRLVGVFYLPSFMSFVFLSWVSMLCEPIYSWSQSYDSAGSVVSYFLHDLLTEHDGRYSEKLLD